MTTYYRDILIDTRTSCSRDEAVAVMLGRRSFDPIYQNLNPQEDPVDVHEQFMGWLNISLFDELIDERDGVLMDLDDAIEDESKENVEACRQRILRCDDTIRHAKLILCDIDDELAKGALSRLRIDQEATKGKGQTYITLSSLRLWQKDQGHNFSAIEASPAQDAPAARHSAESDEPLLNAKGGMTRATTRSFLVTFAVLLEEFIARAGTQFKSESGTGLNEEAIATLLSAKSLPGARQGHFVKGQSVSSIEARIKTIVKTSADAAAEARTAATRSK
jgi:hypothetical protein